MIESIRHKGLREFFEKGNTSKIHPAHKKRLRLILTLLNAASNLKDVNFSGSKLHPLKGKLEGLWAVSVSGNWRVVFRFEDGNVYDVDYVDYH